MKLEATELKPGYWAIRPEGQLGTCGWFPKAWIVQYIRAKSAKEAISEA